MQKQLVYRGLVLGGLVLVLVIALGSIRGLVHERMARSHEVRQDIARSTAGPQTLVGPILVVPFRLATRHQWIDPDTEALRTRLTYRDGSLHLLPDSLRMTGTIRTEARRRGIFAANVYRTILEVEGEFRVPPRFGITADPTDYTFGDVTMAIGVADIRGIVGSLDLHMNGANVSFAPGTGSRALGSGIHAPLTISESADEQRLPFRFELELVGTETLLLTPVGRTTEATLRADWPHPSFVGAFLPLARDVADQGFNATWKTTSIATNLDALFAECEAEQSQCARIATQQLGVSLIDPVDPYVLGERSLKYGVLFIVLTFTGFILFEIVRKARVHPVQYGFIGAGLVVFYLLLLSLSEHLGFALAYLLSSVACIALIGGYVRSILHSSARGAVLTVGLSLLYATLYGVLNAEDHALLLGSGLVFLVLGLGMWLTRRVDWYGLYPPASDAPRASVSDRV